jgi:hypothetical protein
MSFPNINGIAMVVNQIGLKEVNQKKGAACTAPIQAFNDC